MRVFHYGVSFRIVANTRDTNVCLSISNLKRKTIKKLKNKRIFFYVFKHDYPTNNSIESPILIFVSPLEVFILPLSGEIVFVKERLDRISLNGINVDLIVFSCKERRKLVV